MYYFICVNYNNSHHTELFVESVMSQSDDSVAIIVDNNSARDELQKLESKIKCYDSSKVILIKNDINAGYFGGLNIGIQRVPKGMPIIVGNNDLIFESNFTEALSCSKYPDDVIVIAPNVVTKDGYNQNPHCRNRVTKKRKFLYELYFKNYLLARLLTFGRQVVDYLKGGRDNSRDQAPGYIHMGIGACYVLLPSFFSFFDELDNKVFLYGEEAFLAGQLMRVNRKMYYDPNLLVIHAESATLAQVASKTKYNYIKSSYWDYKKYL